MIIKRRFQTISAIAIISLVTTLNTSASADDKVNKYLDKLPKSTTSKNKNTSTNLKQTQAGQRTQINSMQLGGKTPEEAAEEARKEAEKKKALEAQREKEAREAARKAKEALEAAKEATTRKAAKEKAAREAAARKAAEEEARRKQAEKEAEERALQAAAEAQKAQEEALKAAEKAKKEAEAIEKKASQNAIESAQEDARRILESKKKYRKAKSRKSKQKPKSDVVVFQSKSRKIYDDFFNSSQYAKWKSLYTGGHIGVGSDQNGISGGALVGHNWQVKKIVYGVEADVASLSGDKKGTVGNASFSSDSDWTASVRGRVGYLISPDTLLYATAGVAWTNLDTTVTSNGTRRRYSDTVTGFIIGGGVETQLDKDWSARIEYLYTKSQGITVKTDDAAVEFDPDLHTVRLAFVYRF